MYKFRNATHSLHHYYVKVKEVDKREIIRELEENTE